MESTKTTYDAADLAFGALLSGALASAGVALLFLVIDTFRGEPFLTPSILGSALFLGSVPDADAPARLGVMALYTLLHLFVFLCVGAATTFVASRVPALARGVVSLPGFVFVVLMAGVYLVDGFVRPGIVKAVGVGSLALGNLVGAWIIGWFVTGTLRRYEYVAATASTEGGASGR